MRAAMTESHNRLHNIESRLLKVGVEMKLSKSVLVITIIAILFGVSRCVNLYTNPYHFTYDNNNQVQVLPYDLPDADKVKFLKSKVKRISKLHCALRNNVVRHYNVIARNVPVAVLHENGLPRSLAFNYTYVPSPKP